MLHDAAFHLGLHCLSNVSRLQQVITHHARFFMYFTPLNVLHSCMLGNFFMLLFASADIFSKLTFKKSYFRNTIRVSDDLDPDQE